MPEHSAVGYSQANGRSESAVQEIEGHVRTLKAALESRIRKRIPSSHPVIRWIIEHSATTLNKYALHDDGSTLTTAYEQLHGKKASEKIAEFGERILFWVPKRRRAKLDLPWAAGIYLGTTMTTNEAYVALPDGDVVRTGAVCRIRPDQRWRADLLQSIKGIPSKQATRPDDSFIEAIDNPHVYVDDDQRALLDKEIDEPKDSAEHVTSERDLPSLRITRRDLEIYDYTPSCLRCAQIQLGNHQTNSKHSTLCRARVYGLMRDAKDPKLERWMREHPDQPFKWDLAVEEVKKDTEALGLVSPSCSRMLRARTSGLSLTCLFSMV